VQKTTANGKRERRALMMSALDTVTGLQRSAKE
jgi:hypothetical protein